MVENATRSGSTSGSFWGMLYVVIMRNGSWREITTPLMAEACKLAHFGVNIIIGRCTLADANRRRPETIFEAIYRQRWEIELLFKQMKQ